MPIRATVSDFGPTLLAKILGSNETQESSLALVFHYADTKALPLLDLSDLRALLTFLDSAEGKAELEGIGGLSKATVGVLLRDLVGLETGGGNEFFGEPQFEISDLLRTAPDGRGVISCLELAAVQDKPKLFSTVLMWLVAELFEELPEVGDLDKPKLVFFFDEAHLLFNDASKAFLESVTQTVRLIRSKGVGIFFVTQSPKDVPGDVLGQLGNRVQHALRAFTPDDQKALSAAVKTYPKCDFYDLETLLTSMGIGEAAVTILDEKGVPTPVVHSRLPAPRVARWIRPTTSTARRRPRRCSRSTGRASTARARASCSPRASRTRPPAAEADRSRPKAAPAPAGAAQGDRDAVGGGAEAIGDFLNSRQGKQIQKEVIRGVFGLLKKKLCERETTQGHSAAAQQRRLRRRSPRSTRSCAHRCGASSRPSCCRTPTSGSDERWFPDELFPRMGELGFLGLKYEEEYGGQGGDYLHDAVLAEELARCGSGGVAAGLGAHITIATPPVWKFGTEDQKQRYLVPSIAGDEDRRARRSPSPTPAPTSPA